MSTPARALSRLCLLLCPALFATGAEAPPDAVFVGGKVLAVDAGFAIHEALAIRGGRVIAAGSAAQIRALVAPGRTTVHELGGRMLLPGLIDSHVQC